MDRQTNRHAGRQIDRQVDRQTVRQGDRPWTNFSKQDETWAEFSTLDVVVFVVAILLR